MAGTRVAVAILTYRRNDLVSELLTQLRSFLCQGAIDRPAGTTVDVVVIDNDPEMGARQVVGEAAEAARAADTAEVIYRHEPRAGIGAARAHAMAYAEESGYHVVVFIDDDELPEPGWLAALVHTWRRTGAAIVAGRVVGELGQGAHPWVAEGRFFERRDLPTGTVINAAPSGNILIDVQQTAELDVRFAVDLGLRGGEDTLYTRQVHHRGGLMVFCRESVVRDPVPADRATPSWVIQRIYGHGSYEADLRMRVLGGTGVKDDIAARAHAAGRGVLRVGGGVVRLATGVATRSGVRQADGIRTFVRGLGMVSGALRKPYAEYARKGGTGG